MTRLKSHARLFLAALTTSVVSSCGGGGGGDAAPTAPPSAPEVSVNVGIKQLLLSWPAASGATSYKILANPAGVTGFTQVGSETTATRYALDIPVHVFDWAGALYIVQACNALGCADSNVVPVPGAATQAIGYFKPPVTDVDDAFGKAVAVSGDGNTVAVGAPLEDSGATNINGANQDNSAANAGAVYVYVRTSAGWALQAYVKPAVIDAGDNFGSSVALSHDGNTLAVGSPSEDSAATGVDADASNNAASAAGAVYVFRRSGTAWSQQAYVKASNAQAGDTFGAALTLSAGGDTLAVGAWGEDSIATGIDGDQFNDIASNAGAAYLFTRSGDSWTQQHYIKASNTDAQDLFGIALALSDDGATLAVGAIGEASFDFGVDADPSDNAAVGAGAVYVFVSTNATWTQQAYVKASNTNALDAFGGAVALSADGNTLAVGATGEDSEATGVDGDQGGFSAAASGAVYVFTRAGTSWSQQAYIKASNTDADDAFGGALALSDDGNGLVVGAAEEDSIAAGLNGNDTDNTANDSGAAYVFTHANDTWSQRAYIKAPNTAAADAFATALALDGTGGTLAAAANGEDGAATGIAGDQSDRTAPNAGAAYLY